MAALRDRDLAVAALLLNDIFWKKRLSYLPEILF